MALVWEHVENNDKYEVRSAGTSMRLYTNGVFHSQYSPRHLFTGAVWDILTVPILFTDHIIKRVLLLGVGGGTAIHQLNRLVSPEEITGVELIGTHLEIARRFFDVNYDNVKLYHDDAIEWLKRNKERFDVVIDDVFVDGVDDPLRPMETNDKWYRPLGEHLTQHGVLIQNQISPKVAREQVRLNESLLKSEFKSAILFRVPTFENCIVALYRDKVTVKAGRPLAMKRIEEIARGHMRKLDFSCSQLF
ncbi:MAG: methyltransferase domain-containing protein [Pseudomonadales bacterium]